MGTCAFIKVYEIALQKQTLKLAYLAYAKQSLPGENLNAPMCYFLQVIQHFVCLAM